MSTARVAGSGSAALGNASHASRPGPSSPGRGVRLLAEKRRARRRHRLIRGLIRATYWSAGIFVLGWLVISGFFGLTGA